ncbi:Flp pilus assembly protein TadG [Prauserella sediminis]|uniref:Flp pilus assembly protein TadG n=1 Tax=Prauserella sediminis TaxID=577680 RepID=A0A839Y0L7_9PSEU|nr:TadE/TadG family type IV pilus assembly protein [Prauserella sediminis]MBB3666213.1 Flp pilus assembly protein TadG [Prauserella sediminis]
MTAAGRHRTRAAGPVMRVRAAARGDRGEVTVELVLATPLLLLTLLLIIQFALWSHATHVAQAAASQALAAARTHRGTIAAGQDAGSHVLTALAPGPLREAELTVSRGPRGASARVSGHATPVLPGLHLAVTAEASGPRERFVPDTSTAKPWSGR